LLQLLLLLLTIMMMVTMMMMVMVMVVIEGERCNLPVLHRSYILVPSTHTRPTPDRTHVTSSQSNVTLAASIPCGKSQLLFPEFLRVSIRSRNWIRSSVFAQRNRVKPRD